MAKEKESQTSGWHKWRWFIFWVTSIAFFYFVLLTSNWDLSKAGPIVVVFFVGDILFGFFSFIVMLASIAKTRNWGMLVAAGFIFAMFFVLLQSGPSPSNTVANQDKLVSCEIHSSCGGGTKMMKESECNNATCCQIGKVWVVMDKDECKLKQQDYANASKPATTTVVRPQIQIPAIKPVEPPTLCCKESCNSFSGVCTTNCTRTWVCF